MENYAQETVNKNTDKNTLLGTLAAYVLVPGYSTNYWGKSTIGEDGIIRGFMISGGVLTDIIKIGAEIAVCAGLYERLIG